MADEPTGALDSATGKQVFDVLKKLSCDKLVLVVSHDREFAELYADRIIELKDGKVISDVVKTFETSEENDEKLTFAGNDTVLIRKGATLEDEDLKKINAFLSGSDCDVLLSKNGAEIEKYKKNANISSGGKKYVFEEATSTPEIRTYTDDERKLIKSKLPLSRAIKLGASGMKVKPVRFAFTLLLAIITFTMFGLFSTIMFYDSETVAIQTLKDTNEQYLNVSKTMLQDIYNYEDGKLKYTMTMSEDVNYTDSDIAALKEKYGDGVVPVYDVGAMTFSDYMTDRDTFFCLYSFVPAEQVNVTYVSGRPPENDGEIAISEYALSRITGYKYNGVTSADDIKLKYKDFIFTVCGVYKVPLSSDKLVIDDSMPNYYYSTPGDNFMLSGLVTRGFYDKIDAYNANEYVEYVPVAESYTYGIYAGTNADAYVTSQSVQIDYISKSNVIKAVDALALDGSVATTIGDGIAVSFNMWYKLFGSDIEDKMSEKGLDDEFKNQKDEYGYTLSYKLYALQHSIGIVVDDKKFTYKELASELLTFFNENGLTDNYEITFYDNDMNAFATRKITSVLVGRSYDHYNSAIVAAVINSKISASLGIIFSPFSFGILSVLMIIGVAVVTAVISTILPVWFFSKKKPVDTIRNL